MRKTIIFFIVAGLTVTAMLNIHCGGVKWIEQSFITDTSMVINTKGIAGPVGRVKTHRGIYDTLKVPMSAAGKNLYAVSFSTPKNGYIVGQSGTILKVINGVMLLDFSKGGNDLRSVYVKSRDSAVTVGDNLTIKRTVTGDSNWTNGVISGVVPNVTLRGVSFDGNEGYAVGDLGVILHSKDFGANWDLATVPFAVNLHCVSFKKRVNGPHRLYIGGGGGVVFYSINNVLSPLNFDEVGEVTSTIKSISFAPDAVYPFVVSSDGRVYKQIFKPKGAGGKGRKVSKGKWSSSKISSSSLNGVYAIRKDYAYVVGDNGTVARFDGTNWVLQSKPTSKNLNWVDPPAEYGLESAMCVGDDGTIIYAQPPTCGDDFVLDLNGEATNCEWQLGLTKSSTSNVYTQFKICTSEGLVGQGPTSWPANCGDGPTNGWAVNEDPLHFTRWLIPDLGEFPTGCTFNYTFNVNFGNAGLNNPVQGYMSYYVLYNKRGENEWRLVYTVWYNACTN